MAAHVGQLYHLVGQVTTNLLLKFRLYSYGLNCVTSKKDMLESTGIGFPVSFQKVTLFGDKVFVEVIRSKRSH